YQQVSDGAIEPAPSDSDAIRTGYAVHVAIGGGYASRLKLVNHESVDQQVQVTFNGTGILRTIHPNGRLDESLAQMFHITGSGITSGYLSVQTLMDTAGVNGFVEIAGSDGRVLTTAPISGEGQIQMVFSHVAQGSGY